MIKKLKKSYFYLDLPYDATLEQVQTQEKMLIKILRAKALKTGKSQKKNIDRIVESANFIQENLEKNGIPDIKECSFNSSGKTLVTQTFVLIIISAIAIISYLSLIKL